MSTRHSQRGVSLVELIMFIVIVSVALAGILLVMNTTTRGSADPLIHKQALAIAESLLEEVELMPFTFCDPDDANAASAEVAAVAANGCAATVEGIGPETIGGVTEDRYGTAAPAVNAQFDNVSDYDGFAMNAGTGGILDVTGTLVSAALNGYSATVTVVALPGGALPGVAAGDALLITVIVTGPGGLPVVVEGVRTRYAPRALP